MWMFPKKNKDEIRGKKKLTICDQNWIYITTASWLLGTSSNVNNIRTVQFNVIQLPIACEFTHFSESCQNASYNLNTHIDENLNLKQSSQIHLMKSQNQQKKI